MSVVATVQHTSSSTALPPSTPQQEPHNTTDILVTTMSLVSLFNDSFFSDFDRMFDDAFARRTGGGPQVSQTPGHSNSAPRVLRPR